jgi:hydroxyethylthiazole kinase-like uncharacterized protein yjeF
MKYILTAEEMRQADRKAIKEFNIPSLVLMENAARSAAEAIINILNNSKLKEPKIIILCGSGNNGGDGFAIARHIYNYFELSEKHGSKTLNQNTQKKSQLKVIWIGSQEKMSPETLTNFKSVQALNIYVSHVENAKNLESIDWYCDCIIDALIGVGGTEDIHGIAGYLLAHVKDVKTLKIAVDMPTGLNSENGTAFKNCFKAEHTITMFAPKLGMFINEGPDNCGVIHKAYLGATESIVQNLANTYAIEENDIKKLLPKRKRRSSKFDYGRVLVVAGSNLYPGAAALCANAAITAGAGLVQLITTMLHPAIFPEVIPHIVESTAGGTLAYKNFDYIMKSSEKADSVIIGPGLGDVDETIKLVKALIKNIDSKKSLLIDADALKAIDKGTKLRKNIVLTPHTGEFAGITGKKREDIEEDTYFEAKSLAQKLDCIILLKSVPSIITDGNKIYLNLNGNPGMATGGSGDVLSGIIGSFLAQKIEPLTASAFGAYLHAAAGDMYAKKYGQVTLTASDLLICFKAILIGKKDFSLEFNNLDSKNKPILPSQRGFKG